MIKKIKKWDHLAVRPEVFTEFRELRVNSNVGESGRYSDNVFIVQLLKIYKMYLKNKERKANV